MRVAYLCCAGTLSTSTDRRYDAHEHDIELGAMGPAFDAAGDSVVECDWRGRDWHPRDFDLAFVRTTWDYTEHTDEFSKFIAQCSEQCPVANSPRTILWNMSKRYLEELLRGGLSVIPSVFPDDGVAIDSAFETLGCDELILKPIVGAGGEGHTRITLGEELGLIPSTHFAQPVLDEIQTEGELSFVFIGGEFSHAVRKRCAPGEYRVQSNFGGSEERYEPSQSDLETARAFLDATPDPTLAVRIDMVPTSKGLQLMELEAIEPYLFPANTADFGERVHRACQDYIRTR